MKVTIGYYEVEIKAKGTIKSQSRYNKEDTMCLLNQISIWCHEASKQYELYGYDALSISARDACNQIFDALQAEGCYKGLYDNEE